MAIVKANYLPQGPKTPAAAKRAARYYTYRDGPDRTARQWYDADGHAVHYDALQAAVAAHAATYAYTYRMVVSTKDAEIGVDGYRQVLDHQFDRYYLIEHHNTAYPHAHVIGFRTTRARKGELAALRDRVVALEQATARTMEQATPQPEHGHVAPTPGRNHDREQG